MSSHVEAPLSDAFRHAQARVSERMGARFFGTERLVGDQVDRRPRISSRTELNARSTAVDVAGPVYETRTSTSLSAPPPRPGPPDPKSREYH